MTNTCALSAAGPARRRPGRGGLPSAFRRRKRWLYPSAATGTLPRPDRLLLLVLGSSLVLTAVVLFCARRSELSAGAVRAAVRDDLARVCRERAELTQALLRTEGP